MIDLLEPPPSRDVQPDAQRDGWYDPDSATFELLDGRAWGPGAEDVSDRDARSAAVPSEVDWA